MTNVYGNSRDILTLDDELNQSFYETENENDDFNFSEQSAHRKQKVQIVTFYKINFFTLFNFVL